jgi:glutathione S-transferase
MSMPRLIYFDFAGSRGENAVSRCTWQASISRTCGVKSSDWPAMKANTPFGAMPVLEIPGKPPLAHSNAILVFIGRQHRLHPTDAFEAARHEALMSAVEELRHTITPTLRITDEAEKAQGARGARGQRTSNVGKPGRTPAR